MYLAEHKRGEFLPGPDWVVWDMQADLQEWEKREQKFLGKLVELLRVVRERVGVLNQMGVNGVSLVCVSDGSGREDGVEVRLWGKGDLESEGEGCSLA